MKTLNLPGVTAIALGALISVSASAYEVFGETGERWGLGSALEQKGDFDSAIIQYKRALQAVKNLDNQHLQECALMGTVARLEGAKAGKQYIKTYSNAPNALSTALEVSHSRFSQVIDKINAEHPELATSCP